MTESNFQKELEHLINRHSIENQSDTPDFILSKYIMDCLQTLNNVTQTREKWYGRNQKNINDRHIELNKKDSGIEKIIKYCSYLNKIFKYPYYFTFSLPTNHHDESPSGMLYDVTYATFNAGRYLVDTKNLEIQLLFGPINSIVNNHASFRYILDNNGIVEIDFNIKQINLIKYYINESIKRKYNVPMDQFLVKLPTNEKLENI